MRGAEVNGRARPVRPPGERVRGRGLQRSERRPLERYDVAAARMRATGRDPVPAHAGHLDHRALRRLRARPRALEEPGLARASTWRGRTSRPWTGRGARIRSSTLAPASVDDFERRQDAAEGRIVLVTLAPGGGRGDGADRAPRRERACGCPSGTATPRRRRSATRSRAGATLSTHLGNGCASGDGAASEPDLGAARRGRDRRPASSPTAITSRPPRFKAMVRAKTPARAALVTDAVAPAGLRAGTLPRRHHRGGAPRGRTGDDGRRATAWPDRRCRWTSPSATRCGWRASRWRRRWPWPRPCPPGVRRTGRPSAASARAWNAQACRLDGRRGDGDSGGV